MHPYMNLSIRIFYLSVNLSIRNFDLSVNLSIMNLVIVMKPFCGNSNS